MKREIKFVRDIRRTRRKIKKLLRTYDYLENGSYLIVFGDLISVVNHKYAEYVEIARRGFLKGLILSVLNPQMAIKTDNPAKQYQTVFLTMDEDLKFIDYKNNVMYTIYSSPEKKSRMVKNLNYFGDFVKTTFIRCDNGGVLEKYIKAESRKYWDEDKITRIYASIISDTRMYLDKVRSRGFYKTHEVSPEDYDDIREYFGDVFCGIDLSDVIGNIGNVSLCMMHGDLHLDNVLTNGNEVYYIDFEDAREEIFFYDVFNVMFVEYINYDSTFLLDKYIDGDVLMMNAMGSLFSCLDCEFKEVVRVDYVLLYILHRLRHDVCNIAEKSKKKESDRKETIEFLQGRYRSFIMYMRKRTVRENV